MAEVTDLRQYEIFGVFSDDQLSELARISEKKAYKRLEHIYERGSPATHLFLVNKGLVSLRNIGSGDLVGISFETCGSGGLFGTASLMKPHEHSLTAVCMEDSEVIAIEADRLLELCEKNPGLGHCFMLVIAQLYFDRYKRAKKQLCEMVKAPTVITALPG
jgi:CRP-like cAMP-binding protein